MSSVVQHAPRFTEEDAACIAKDLYGLDASVKLLPSERDQNFHLTAVGGDAYVLKIANSTEQYEVLDFQNKAMMHMAENNKISKHYGTICPEVFNTQAAEQIAMIKGKDNHSHYVRLLSYLPGKPLALVKPHDSDLLRSLGRFFGEIDQTLKDFDHPGIHRDFHWDLKNAGKVVDKYLDSIPETEKRNGVRSFLKRFTNEIEPQLPDLRTSVIHNDGNDYNVLVTPEGDWHNKVSGVIDFGDMVYTQTVNELAIVCAYAMLDKADPLTSASHVVSGYHRAFPLTEQELVVLFDLICMRLCTSVCMSAHQIKLDPENEYLRISEKPAWNLLNRLIGIHPRFAEAVFRQSCGLKAVPDSKKIVAWLKDNQDGFASIVGANLKNKEQLVFDLSVDTSLFDAEMSQKEPTAISARLFQEMESAGATVGIGRYGEARLLYKAEQYEVETDEMPEWRTIHLGVDLFMESGTPVYAPMDGKIHSFNNNTDPLDYGPAIILEHETTGGDRFFTLYGHLSLDSLDEMQVGLRIEKGQALARIGDSKINGGWPPHLHFQIIIDIFDETGTFPGVARPSLQDVWKSICPDPNIILGIPAECFPQYGRSKEDILDLRSKHLGRNLSIAYDSPLKIVRGIGQYLISDDGRAYVDGVNNVCHVGHSHPHVVSAGHRQMTVLNTNTRYLHDNIIEYSRRLLETFPEPLSVCFFVCSGSEANELALRLARTYTGQTDMITVDGAYHGNTQALIDISPYKHDGPGGKGAPPWVHTVVMPDSYRGPHKGTSPDTGAAYAQYVQAAIEDVQSSGRGIAAFICESILGCGGQLILPDQYMKEAFGFVREAGGVCIVDEVQVGFGRVGSHYWAFETQNVVPDIVTLGKPMGNGHPLAAVITTPHIADAFANGMEYFNTFGGNPVSCAIGMAVLDVIQNEGLQENAFKVGERLLNNLEPLKERFPLVGDVRGLGLFVGIELVTDREKLNPAGAHASYISNRMKDYGFLIGTDGPDHNVLKLKPPIVFSEKNADDLADALEVVLGEDRLQVGYAKGIME